METEKAVVVPLHEVADVPDTEMMLRMILNHEALLVKRSNAPMEKSSSWISAQASGHFAKALSQVTQEMGSIPGNDLYHVILPPGTTTKDLVAAVGGGFRGLTRQAGSTKISGQVRLIPATGASIAAGPMIATVALAMAGDMLAQHQMNAKLDAIHHEVAAMRNRFSDDDKAVLVAAEKQSRLVAGYLLDEARIPAISTASQAFGDLEKLTYRYVEQLDRWSDTVKRYGKKLMSMAQNCCKSLQALAKNRWKISKRRQLSCTRL